MTGRKLLTGVVAMGLVFTACGGSDTVATTEVPTTTETAIVTTTEPSTTTTQPPIDVFTRVQVYLVASITREVEGYIDQQLAEAGESASYSLSVDLNADPVVAFDVTTQADADVLNEVAGEVSIFDTTVVYTLLGGALAGAPIVPTLSGDETFASLQLPPVFIDAGFLDGFGELMTQMGFPSSTVAKMENTRALDGTQTTEGDGYVASWTYHPDDGLSIILERR